MKKRVLKIVVCTLFGTLIISNYSAQAYGAENDFDKTEFSLEDLFFNTTLATSGLENITKNKVEESILANKGAKNILVERKEENNLAISKVTDYVNIRKEDTEESEVVGKLYANSAATVIGIEGDWSKIESGTVTGLM